MLYQLKNSKAEESIIQQAQRLKKPLPKHIADAPDLHLGLELFYRAFIDLTTCRSVGMGLGPIPWTAINDYALRLDFSPEQTEDLFYFVGKMDVAYLEYNSAKMESKTPSSSRKSFRRKPS